MMQPNNRIRKLMEASDHQEHIAVWGADGLLTLLFRRILIDWHKERGFNADQLCKLADVYVSKYEPQAQDAKAAADALLLELFGGAMDWPTFVKALKILQIQELDISVGLTDFTGHFSVHQKQQIIQEKS
jgi:hypothetical protein